MKKQNKSVKSLKKLSLNKETLILLTHQESLSINGGGRLSSDPTGLGGCTVVDTQGTKK